MIRKVILALLSACGLSACVSFADTDQTLPATPNPASGNNETVVKLIPTSITRMNLYHIAQDLKAKPNFKEELVVGELNVGKDKIKFYLPRHGPTIQRNFF